MPYKCLCHPIHWLAVTFLAFTLGACVAEPSSVDQPEATGKVAQKEAWSPADDSTIFAPGLERRWDRLPAQGEVARVPWTGSYWGTTDDSINYRWDGPRSDSASMKYQKAFGTTPGSTGSVEDAVSRAFGVDSCFGCKECKNGSECNSSTGEVCAKRNGAESGRCIPTWYGLCHAWAAAAILWPEPLHEVTKNGVTFKIQDLKALATAVHNSTSSKFVSMRCNLDDNNGVVTYDSAGRAEPQQCRDTNPGTYHLLITNYLGTRRQSFIEDRRFDMQVWNQPLRGYRIAEQRKISSQEAASLVAPTTAPSSPTAYHFNPMATSFLYVRLEVSYIREASSTTDGSLFGVIDSYTLRDVYQYVLELDASENIVGGEWIDYSKREHPDFLWLPLAAATATIADGQISYATVKELIDLSVAPPQQINTVQIPGLGTVSACTPGSGQGREWPCRDSSGVWHRCIKVRCSGRDCPYIATNVCYF